jgi:acylphosphatase
LAKHLIITGLVQGVGYRVSFAAQARSLKLAGWVRNRADGSVEAMVRGDASAIEQIIDWAHRGPPAAQVQHVAVEDIEDTAVLHERFDVQIFTSNGL